MPDVSLTAEQLKDVIQGAVAAAVAEARKPAPPTEKEAAEMLQAQEYRKQQAASVIEQKENEKKFQRICSHQHTKREGGGTHCVHVREEDPTSPGYILCQKCQARVRPVDGKNKDRGAIYDTHLFNTLFQDCNDGGLIQ